ncbi:winged helix-turn-helix transcriptional regulator [Amycolatopsis alkalitolerans]|uniref:Helix-turn-helix transcriptional regulator n=1 Tax=Amycolatopsis alkalitolerans TaxID=2547244 RepID=A0A5C4MDC9_9PSEU|nr:helix-turn-helix domain-containing protein [Amycolatopsis alkalitolerans]TNC29533.1 helix-turn-helix transcriptional regulator [Amycolatopsis alkalitolerans]
MHEYGQYCPIALGAEVLAERWTPIIVRNLLVGCARFGEILDGAPGLPRSVLAQRLRRLERDGVVERTGTGRDVRYRLTESGRELADVVLALGVWGARWRESAPAQWDPYLILWTLSRLIDPSSLPRRRVVVRFDLTGDFTPGRYWIVASEQGSEVCVTSPGFAEDGVVVTDVEWLYRWHVGQVGLGAAERAGGMTVTAPRWLARTLSAWGSLSPFAGIKPARTGKGPV